MVAGGITIVPSTCKFTLDANELCLLEIPRISPFLECVGVNQPRQVVLRSGKHGLKQTADVKLCCHWQATVNLIT